MAQPLVKNGKATYKTGDLEKYPLLASIKKEEEQQYDGYNRASISSAVFSLSTTIVGAGIMGLPSTMNVIGLVPGCIMLVSLGFLTNTSIEFLLRYSCKSKVVSYGGVMADSFGRFGRTVLQISVIFNNFGLLVVYLIIIADVLSGSASSSAHHSGVLEEWAGGQTWWNSRFSVMLATTLLVLAPLVSFRHIDSLEVSSACSVFLAVLFVVLTAAIVAYKLIAGTIEMPRLFPELGTDASTLFSYFSTVPIFVTAYICHHSVHPILNELQRPSDAKNVVRVSIVLCTLIYVATSVFCFSLFGEDTLSDVLSNFDVDLGVPHSALLTAIIRVGYAIHLMLVYPLLNFSLRLNLDGLIFPRAVPLSVDTRRFTVLTASILALTFLGASFIPDIYDAFQLTGSTSAVCIGFVFPAVLVLRDVHNIASIREKVIAWFMVLLAAGASMVALIGDIYDLF